MASPRRLKIKSATVKKLTNDLGNAVARRVRLDIADLNPRSPLNSRIEQVVARRQENVAKVMAGYYSSMVREVANILRDPPVKAYVYPSEFGTMGFPAADKVNFSKSVSLSVGKGVTGAPTSETVKIEPGVSTRKAWRPLSIGYAASLKGTRWEGMPRSINFWRKTSKLNALMAAWYAQNYKTVFHAKNYKVGKITRTKRLGKNVPYAPGKVISGYTALPREGVMVSSNTKQLVATYTFAVQPPRLGHPALDQVLRRSYISGKPQKYWPTRPKDISVSYKAGKLAGRTIEQTRQVSRLAEDPRDFYRLLLPEHSRPMLARFAAAVGRKEMAALRKLLQRK
jgi:hypothetical protein